MRHSLLPLLLLLLLPLITFSQPPEKKKYLDSLQAILSKSDKDTHRVNTLNRMGMELKLFNPDSAIQTLDQSIILSRELNFPQGEVAALNQLGIIYKNKADFEKAIAALEKGIAMAEKNGMEEQKAKMSVNLGNIYQRKGEYNKALEKFYGSLAFFEKQGNRKIWAGIYSNIGIVYSQMQDHPKAMELYRKAISLRDSVKDRIGIANDHGNIAIEYSYLAKTVKNKNYVDSALYYYGLSLEGLRNAGDIQGVAHMLNNIAELYIQKGREGDMSMLKKAEKDLLEALSINEQIGDKSGIGINYNSLASVYELLGDMSRAESSRKKAYSIAVEIGEKETAMEIAYGLFTHYQERRQFEKALEFHVLYANWKDSVLNDENQKAIREIETKYETEKNLREIELLRKNNEISELSLKTSRYFNWGLVIVSVLALAFLALYINRFLSKKKTAQVLAEQNFKIQEQKAIIEERNKDITDSINYAGKIQQAILPSHEDFKKHFPDSFVLFRPRDIVSGDFTWILEKDGIVYFTAADCTGHGVPGAMVSLMCSNALTKCVKELGINSPAAILDETVKILEEHFSLHGSEMQDGMDLALCAWNRRNGRLEFAGANNPLYYLESGELKEIKGDKQPVGKYASRKPFTNHSLQMQKGTAVYLFTDGLADQFGGPKGKKFKNTQLRELIQRANSQRMEEQGKLLEKLLLEWQGSYEQVDDICVIGMRV